VEERGLGGEIGEEGGLDLLCLDEDGKIAMGERSGLVAGKALAVTK